VNGLPTRLPPIDAITTEDSWLRSAQDGRYLLLRGVCFGPSAKLPPYLPFRRREDWKLYESYIDLLLACGFTTLRLPFLWSAFEPVCNPIHPKYNEEYLADFFYYVDLFAKKGFLIFIDVHQDLVGTAFGGSGMPDWVRSEGTKSRAFMKGTPLWGLNYVFNKHLRKTFTEFWSNDLTNPANDPPLTHFKVRDRFLDTIERLAEMSSRNPRVFGLEIFNEPHPATIDDRKFEEEVLPAFYGEALRRIRKYSPHLFAFVSPQSDWNVNVRSNRNYDSYLKTMGDDPRVVFAYHYYDSALTGLYGLIFNDAKRDEYLEAQELGSRRAKEKGMVPFLTEFGTRQSWMRSIVRRHMDWQFESVEHALINATYWNVNLYNTEEERDGFMREDFSLLGPERIPRNLDVVTRPYAVASSAEPVHSHFNLRTKEFELVLRSSKSPLGGMSEGISTQIYIPATKLHPLQPVHYPGGFDIQYNGKLNYQFDRNQLDLTLDPAIELHDIVIRPKE
jgi:hypothetical protein